MTVSEMAGRIGQTVLVDFEQIEVNCKIVDAKCSWGRVRFLIFPLGGVGSQWVEEARIHAEVK